MCGIAGFLSFQYLIKPETHLNHLNKMTEMMLRRGPDDSGVWIDPQGRVGFGFRRLSILDLSPAGHQPMSSHQDRSVLMLNGEIYNFIALRHELEGKGYVFKTRTDTEVLLAALESWGLEKTLALVNGMFAFAWYDRVDRILTLARDHAGIKPLYYALDPERRGLTFASQYDVLLNGPWGIPGEVDLDVLRLYLKLHHIPPPGGLHKYTWQLEPGSYIQINSEGQLVKKQWWRLPRRVEDEFIPLAEAIDLLGGALDESIRRQRIADVPVGVFLSGGIDSPLVSAIARQQTGPQLKAFTISIPGWRQDEAEDARRYAQYLGLDHHVIDVSGEDALELIDEVIQAQYEPFGDYSILPSLLVSKHARAEITVALSGDGGDELFFGYERPLSLLKNGRDFRWPWLVRAGMYGAGKFRLLPQKSEVIISRSPADYYFGVNSRLPDTALERIAPMLRKPAVIPDPYAFDRYRSELDLANYSRYVEYYGQLQRGLKKVDMASSQQSLEVRVPLLDRQVLDLSLKINPLEMMKDRKRKWVLQKLLEKHVPTEMIPTTKRGFAIPLGDWLRGPLKRRVEETLFDKPLYPYGIFDVDTLSTYWHYHLSKAKDHKWGLWTILSLQWWASEHLNI